MHRGEKFIESLFTNKFTGYLVSFFFVVIISLLMLWFFGGCSADQSTSTHTITSPCGRNYFEIEEFLTLEEGFSVFYQYRYGAWRWILSDSVSIDSSSVEVFCREGSDLEYRNCSSDLSFKYGSEDTILLNDKGKELVGSYYLLRIMGLWK